MLRDYYRLAKPGIVYGNLLTVIAGFLYASKLAMLPYELLAVVAGMAFVIGGSCVLNNVLDRDIDAHMERTKSRATVTGAVSIRNAVIYGTLLIMLGLSLLTLRVNGLSALIALSGVVAYVLLYTPIKRKTRAHTLIGSIAGAVPILAGYTAYANEIGTVGSLLFIIMVLWQMPHFYAIAIYRADDYARAGVPTLLSEAGSRATRTAIIVYITCFGAAQVSLFMLGFAGYTYFIVTTAFSIAWLARSVRGEADSAWARALFGFSLRVLVVFSCAISLTSVLP